MNFNYNLHTKTDKNTTIEYNAFQVSECIKTPVFV